MVAEDNVAAREPPANSIDARIRDTRARLDKLLLDYTDKHPDVIAVREALSRLEAQRARQLRSLGVAAADQQVSALGANPVYQAVQIALNEADVQIATLTADAADRQRRLDELQSLIGEVPEVEAELARLNRDYAVVREQYQVLIQSRETQTLSRKASDTDRVEFRVLNPPQAGFAPVAPPRLQLIAAVLAGAFAAGGALCYLVAQFKPIFSSSRALREASGLPVLGVVSRVLVSPAIRRRRRFELVSFSAAMSSLVLMFAFVLWFEMWGPGLKSLLSAA
jgi:polysaccharide chain length determinant protein (PEP-CTERM system associated)